MKLILFDIDGTLLDARGAGSRALMSSLAHVFGRPFERNGVPFAGRTDRAIITDLMTANGVPESDLDWGLQSVFRWLPHFMQIESDLTPSVAYPGVHPLLNSLREQKGHLPGLLTGNLEITSNIKLVSAGIDVSQFLLGAFGDESADRRDLPPLAIKRASALMGEDLTTALVVGDTPGDIDCAHANGLSAMAVATGPFTVEELASHNPEYLLPNFADIDSVLSAFLQF